MPQPAVKKVMWEKRAPAGDDEGPLLEYALPRLKAARDRRTAPYVDTTPYVNWNAMMASAFLHAGAVLDRPECNALALKVLERIWAEAWDEGRGMGHVIGRAEPRGLLEDNVDAAAAFLDAWEATGDEAWLTRAIAVMRYCGRAHWDDAQGGFFDVARDRSGAAYLATPAKPVQDSPTPSANGVAALVLARLWAVTDDNEWRRLLDRQLAPFAGAALQLALYGATLVRSMHWALNPGTRVDDLGCNFFDTADVYGHGHSEQLLGEALAGIRQRVLVATKVGGNFYNRAVNPLLLGRIAEAVGRPVGELAPDVPLPVTHDADFSPEYVRFAVEQSLRRLATDYIDLLQLHNPALSLIADPDTYLVLEDLKRER